VLDVAKESLCKKRANNVVSALPPQPSLQQKESLYSLQGEYAVVISAVLNDVACRNILMHSADTQSAVPAEEALCRIPYCHMEEVSEHLAAMNE
jgi:hypothetical protein